MSSNDDDSLLNAQDKIHAARGILLLCQERAFSLSETTGSVDLGAIIAIAQSVDVSRQILMQALEIVDTFDCKIRDESYDRKRP